MRCVTLRHAHELIDERLTCNIAMTTALLGAAAISGGASVLGGLFGKSAAEKAANVQAQAAMHAADLQHAQYEQTRQDEMPWLQAGQTSLQSIMNGLAPGGQFTQHYNNGQDFKAPTEADVMATPGYQFTRDEGNRAILNGNAAAGGVFSGGTLQALDKYNTGLADSTYNSRFTQALQSFDTNFNQFNVNQTNDFNRLAGVAQAGMQTANSLGAFGANATTQQANDLTDAAAAKAGGIQGGSNALWNGIGGAANSVSGYLTLAGLMGSSKPIPLPPRPTLPRGITPGMMLPGTAVYNPNDFNPQGNYDPEAGFALGGGGK